MLNFGGVLGRKVSSNNIQQEQDHGSTGSLPQPRIWDFVGRRRAFCTHTFDGSGKRRSPVEVVNNPIIYMVLDFFHARWCRISETSTALYSTYKYHKYYQYYLSLLYLASNRKCIHLTYHISQHPLEPCSGLGFTSEQSRSLSHQPTRLSKSRAGYKIH